MSKKLWGGVVAAVIVLIGVGALVLSSGEDANATETDGAFVTEMAPHHESAIEMAEIAIERAEHPEIEALARSIAASQGEEITELEAIHQRLFDAPVGEVDHGTLGLAEHEMGMSADLSSLESAKPFDRAFIDMMVPHHQGAILMARIELEQGTDDEAQALAEKIIEAQTTEIVEMNEWRAEWYGEPSPAGGVPPEDSSASPSHESMGH